MNSGRIPTLCVHRLSFEMANSSLIPHSSSMPQSVVAFADALGTTASSSSDTTAVNFLGRLQRATARVSKRMERIGHLYHIHVRWFSDSIAMSVRFDESAQLVGLLENLAFVQAGYALDGIFLRGAVTVGPHHHSEYIDYGPALAEAVQLEKSRAGNTMRIVLSSSLQHDLHAFGMGNLPVAEDLGDHAYFLDFLGSLDPVTWLTLRSQIEASYHEAEDSNNVRVLQKLAWLASYYNWRTRSPKPLKFALDNRFREVPLPKGGIR